jgi:Phytanoyl-CoA dioxygenase (PhyH)
VIGTDERELDPSAARSLEDDGFVVLPEVVTAANLARLTDAYDRALRDARPPDLSIGRTTTRLSGLLRRDAAFDGLHERPAILDACRRTIRGPFALSTLLARTLHPRAMSQDLHVDAARDAGGWPMIGFILMIDDFREANGATRFVRGSHRAGADAPASLAARAEAACGPAGSLIVYNGSVVHGHGINATDGPRRSIQGAYVRTADASRSFNADRLGRRPR